MHIMGHARALNADVRLRPLAFLLLPLFLISAFITLMRVTSRQKSQIIHVHWVLPNGLVAAWVAAIRNIPFVISLHGSDIFIARRNPLFGAVAGWIFRRAAAVTACSVDLQQGAIALGASEETVLLPWGADPLMFHPAASSEIRHTLVKDPANVILVALGRLVPKKGFDVLLASLPKVIEHYPKVQLVIAGDGPLKYKLSNQVSELGLTDYVAFTGQVPWDRVPGILAAADIFVLPSMRDHHGNVDGLPTVLPEAMGCGVSVISSDIGGARLIIEHDRNGLLVPSDDPQALSEAILVLVGDPDKRHSLGMAARQSVVQHFNWETVAQKILKLCERANWRQAHSSRLGTLYRVKVMSLLQKRPNNGRVLDIGCHDGYWLNNLDVSMRVGVDIEPETGAPGVAFVCADGNNLPFADGAFDYIYALDVIEHIKDDGVFAKSLIRMIAPGGKLFLSTPSVNIRLNPPFLTRWISLQWGHDLRLGYTPDELLRLFKSDLELQINTWSAPGYRFWYLPLRMISIVFPSLAKQLVERIAYSDIRSTSGEEGFLHIEGIRYPNSEPPKRHSL
jgi:glycosyltransferase involved in cell wall biosynthesis